MKIINFYHKHKKIILISLGVLLAVGIYYFKNYNPPVAMQDYGGGFVEEKLYALNSQSVSADLSVVDVSAKVIKTGSLNLHVDDVRAKSAEIKTYVEGLGGYVGESGVNKGDSSYNASMTLRIPSDKFEETLVYLQELAMYVNSVSTNASDVTEFYNDLEAKIANRKALEQQYLDILKKAESVDAIVSITTALANVRSEIETFEIEKKSYDNQISYSMLNLYLEEDASAAGASESWSPETTYQQAVSDWVVFLQTIVDKGIYALIYGWPLLIFYILYRIARRTK